MGLTGLNGNGGGGGGGTGDVNHAAANTFTVGPQTFQSDDPGHIAAIDQAAAGQTASIREIRDSTGQVLVKVDAHGNIVAVALDPPAAPTLGLATGGDITGTAYQWACTLVNAQGETDLGAKTLATDLTDQQQSLTMPVSAPDGCTFNLYRNASAGSEWDQVTTGLAPGDVYVDDTLDVALGSAAPTGNTTAPNIGVPGLSSDGGANSSPVGEDGLTLQGALQAGLGEQASPDTVVVYHALYGNLAVTSGTADLLDGDSPISVVQGGALDTDRGNTALQAIRVVKRNGHVFTSGLIYGRNTDELGHAAPDAELLLQLDSGPMVKAAVNSAGGLGLFGKTPPTAPRTLAQSVIDAITDANAKTAVQALADALSDMGALTLT